MLLPNVAETSTNSYFIHPPSYKNILLKLKAEKSKALYLKENLNSILKIKFDIWRNLDHMGFLYHLVGSSLKIWGFIFRFRI